MHFSIFFNGFYTNKKLVQSLPKCNSCNTQNITYNFSVLQSNTQLAFVGALSERGDNDNCK